VPLQKREKITPDPVRLRKAHPATLAEVTVRLVTVTLDAEPCAAPLDLPAPRRAGRVTISAVARAAGVSTTTVSRFLNGGCVSSSLRARITRVVRDLEYTPSFSARSLQARRSGRIGVVHASHQSASFGQILAGIEERLASTGQSVLLANLAADGQGDANQDHGAPHLHRIDSATAKFALGRGKRWLACRTDRAPRPGAAPLQPTLRQRARWPADRTTFARLRTPAHRLRGCAWVGDGYSRPPERHV
jgi:hypothetical protein